MPELLYTLSYVSRNAIDNQDVAEVAQEIEAILAIARHKNAERGITGALLYSAGCFAQVLEGPLSQVETTFERIQLDPRHRDVQVLHFHPMAERSFGDWSMAFAGMKSDASENAKIDAAPANPESIVARPDALDFIAVLRDLIARHEMHRL